MYWLIIIAYVIFIPIAVIIVDIVAMVILELQYANEPSDNNLIWTDVLIIFPRNASFREYYVFVSNTAAAASATSQFRCQHDNFWRI